MPHHGRMLSMTVLILLSSIVFWSCQHQQYQIGSNRNNAPPTPATSTVAPSGGTKKNQIRSIDFRNFTYDWYPPEYRSRRDERVILKDGSMDVELAPGKEPRKFYIVEVKYGDLTQDGNEEALVIMGVITSGTARDTLLFVYGMSGDAPKRYCQVNGGRCNWTIHSA